MLGDVMDVAINAVAILVGLYLLVRVGTCVLAGLMVARREALAR